MMKRYLTCFNVKPFQCVSSSKFFVFCLFLLFVSPLSLTAKEKSEPRIANIINFIRDIEPRPVGITKEILYETVVKQAEEMRRCNLVGTYLLQYDALIDPKYQQLMKEEKARGCEIGGWWEITEPHVLAAGIKWRGRYPWDWHSDKGFSVGYTPEQRLRLVDVYMQKFKEVFGEYPASVGSWFIDARTLDYMHTKYGLQASCNCRDQVGTDGYTLWGGYWSGAYYPAKENEYMPAQSKANQIDVPVFRMLGSDPVYQYDFGVGGESQHVATLEPVYPACGGNEEWIRWFLKEQSEEPCIGYTYLQAGQENSFAWKKIKTGFLLQMPLIKQMADAGKLKVQTLQESGQWFRRTYAVTPPTISVGKSTPCDPTRSAVWYNSRYYRCSLAWQDGKLTVRDVHLFSERYTSNYLDTVCTSNLCYMLTLPFVDGCLWNKTGGRAGLVLYKKNADGTLTELEGTEPKIVTKGNVLLLTWPLRNGKGDVTFKMSEKRLEIVGNKETGKYPWLLELRVAEGKALPFTAISSQRIAATQRDFTYSVGVERGNAVDQRMSNAQAPFYIEAQGNKIVLDLSQEK